MRDSAAGKAVAATASRLAAGLIGLLLAASGAQAGIAESWQGTYWGEPSGELLAHFGAAAAWWDPLESTCRHASLSIL